MKSVLWVWGKLQTGVSGCGPRPRTAGEGVQ